MIQASMNHSDKTVLNFQEEMDLSVSVHALFLALQHCFPENEWNNSRGSLSFDFFDLENRTLTLPPSCIFGPDTTDEDIASFRIVSHINGNIILQNSCRITELCGFNCLKSVQGDFVIQGSGLEHIHELNALKRVGGKFVIAHNNKLISVSGVSGLEQLGRGLSILNNTLLASVNGFNSLHHIDQGNLEIIGNPSLRNINGLVSLEAIGGTLHLEQSLKLENIDFLSNLTSARSLWINKVRLTDPAPLGKVFDANSNFPGFIKITSCSLQNLSFMRGLNKVGSSLYLHKNFLTNLQGLETLQEVGASLSLSQNKLADIKQLSNLKKINGLLALSDNVLTSLSGLDNLESVKTASWNGIQRSIELNGNPALKDIRSLSGIKEGNNSCLFIRVDKQQTFTTKPDYTSVLATNRMEVIDAGTTEKLDISAIFADADWQLFEEIALCTNGHNCSICRNQKYGRAWRQTLQGVTALPPGGIDFPCPYGKPWTRYGYVSKTHQLSRKNPLTLAEQFRFAERYADQDSFPKEKWGNEIDVVYPFLAEEGDSHDELRFSVRSLSHLYEKPRVWIVGDKPKWLNESTAHYIPHTKTSPDRYIDSRAKVRLAAAQAGIGGHFLLMNDDFFIIVPTCAAFLGIPRYFADYTNNIESFEVTDDYHVLELKGLKALQEKGRLLRNYSLHWPYMHKTINFLELYDEFMLDKIGHNHETLYYNTYSNKMILFGGELLRINKVVKENIILKDIPNNIIILNSKKYSFKKIQKLLQKLFPNKSEFEK